MTRAEWSALGGKKRKRLADAKIAAGDMNVLRRRLAAKKMATEQFERPLLDGINATGRFLYAYSRLAPSDDARHAELEADPRVWRPDPDER